MFDRISQLMNIMNDTLPAFPEIHTKAWGL